MNEKKEVISQLEIFELGQALAKALNGEKEAIADVGILLNRHPEMYQNMEHLIKSINETISNPEIVIKNPKGQTLQDVKAIKRLEPNYKKMGDVGIRNDGKITVLYHANEINAKKYRHFLRLAASQQSMVGTPNSYTQAQSLDERLVPKNISLTASPTIPQQTQNVNNNPQQDKPLTKEEFMQQEQEKMANAKKIKETKKKDEELEI